MLNKLKDPELNQKLFGFLDPHKKEELIKNDKNMKLSLETVIAKECDADGTLKFEGETLKGKRNGKGKEFYKNGKIMFEGVYRNGKRWTGKAYDPKGNAAGELVEGKGSMKEYDYKSGELIFDGQYFNGERK